MHSRPVMITPPAEDVVTLAEFKDHAIADDFTDDDNKLAMLLKAAIGHLDGYTGVLGRCMVTQTWRVGFSRWHCFLPLPFPDVSSVVIKYFDTDALEVTLSSSLYELIDDAKGTSVRFKDAFADPALSDDMDLPVSVEVTAGYGDADDVPDPLKVAIMVNAKRMYDGPGGADAMADMLVAPYRWLRV